VSQECLPLLRTSKQRGTRRKNRDAIQWRVAALRSSRRTRGNRFPISEHSRSCSQKCEKT
jgi:hypothetical protein